MTENEIRIRFIKINLLLKKIIIITGPSDPFFRKHKQKIINVMK